MRRPVLLAVAGGAVLVAGLLTLPALAADDESSPPLGAGPYSAGCWGGGIGSGIGSGIGPGMGPGMGMGFGPGVGRGRGTWSLDGLAKGTLTERQRTALTGRAEAQKLAHDVYAALARSHRDDRFAAVLARVASSEAASLEQARALLERYGVPDPTAGKASGVFSDRTTAQRYRDLVARGSASGPAALAVGRQLEIQMIGDLEAARSGVTAPDVLAVYRWLSHAASMHLHAFGG